MKAAGKGHWADIYADRIIRERGDKALYVCASGITPSGTVHIGNFREIITVDLVVRALRDRGKEVRFIYSWDDYDVFRKVPANMPQKEMLREYLRKPITLTPDPYGLEKNYARRNERDLEELLPRVGIHPDFIYQADRYRASVYAEEIKTALEKKDAIKNLLDEHRTSPLPDDWWPVTIFCSHCEKDTTEILDWDGSYALHYICESCGNDETVDLRESSCTKLLWRIDWPMRWWKEGVDFEPGGKDHHSEGGSFDTAKGIVRDIYGGSPPVSFQYDFIGIKGRGGKISSSTGEVVGLREVLEVYQPEVVRYLFAGTRPNVEFSISFDLDVIKIYEDYDRSERISFGLEEAVEKRMVKERRIYELSQVEKVPEEMPVQAAFRHLSNFLQIYEGNIGTVLAKLSEEHGHQSMEHVRVRAQCAWNWITRYAPDDFRFHLRADDEPPVDLNEVETKAVRALAVKIERDDLDEKGLSEAIYNAAQDSDLQPKDFFKVMYRILVGKEMGPRLAGFILNIGKDRILRKLAPYR